MSNVNILFYSNNCEGSQQLISLMQNEKLIKFFHLICLDTHQKLYPQIKMTPTIIIRGVPVPYVGAEAFSWLARIKQWKINIDIQKASAAQKEYLKNINKNLISEEDNQILNFSKAEMDGLSDVFAYLNNDEPLPHTYFDIQNLGKEKIITPPIDTLDNRKQKEKHKNTSKNLVANIETERKKQDEMFKQHIENFKKQYVKK